MGKYQLNKIRKYIIGNNLVFHTPFGERHLLYIDYTASGRGVKIIEDKIQNILKFYANTHTEDDYSGKYLTHLFHQAEARIKDIVNAGEYGKIIFTGSGTTGALKRLQEILGLYIPPVTLDRINKFHGITKDKEKQIFENKCPVVFIGPYEHHTNELMWRESFVEVVVIKLDTNGMIDLKDLEDKLKNPAYKNRKKIGSFSACSNVTGVLTNVYDIARLCHKYNSLVFFDFAAVAPYKKIDMNKDEESYFDGIMFSPHKFLGGPGTCGVLVFNEKIYRNDLPPTTAGGGTVLYVGFKDQDYFEDIEMRENAGTPPIIQAIKTALVLDLKEKIGINTIQKIEEEYKNDFINKLKEIENVVLIGDISAENKIPIISFNIIHKDRILHPKFVSKLFNDLFGIQSRAGCMCAGPYGHHLLNINYQTSLKYRKMILQGFEGIKPGWVRLNLHYTLSKEDIDYLIKCIGFIAKYGDLFLSKYEFDMNTAEWKFIGFEPDLPRLSINEMFDGKTIKLSKLPKLRKLYLKQAHELVKRLKKNIESPYTIDNKELEEIKYFYYYHKTKD
jgi:selenocysteine lyase/cysteine desulfurase